MNVIPNPGGFIYVDMPTPDQLAENAMAIHHLLDLLIRVNFPPGKGVRGDQATDLLPLLHSAKEQARRLACDIDRLARA